MTIQVEFPVPLVNVAQAMLDRQLWAQRVFGNPTIAAAMFLAYLKDEDGWLSVQELAAMSELSEDTVRRTVARLVPIGRVYERIEGRQRLYRLSPEVIAKATEVSLRVPKQIK